MEEVKQPPPIDNANLLGVTSYLLPTQISSKHYMGILDRKHSTRSMMKRNLMRRKSNTLVISDCKVENNDKSQ